MIWHERGGSASRTVLLLHGLGATGAVWAGVQRSLEQRGMQWITPDLSGHGLSPWLPSYSIGQLASQVAPLVQDTEELYVVGHSLGVYVGLALASRWFGANVIAMVGVGPKVTWSEADLHGTRELAKRPVRWYPQETEAAARYRRVSGLEEKIAEGDDFLARGILQADEGFRLSQDPRTFMVGGAPFSTLLASAEARVRLACGEHDTMVSLDELHSHQRDALEIPASGHNVHVENPALIVELLERLIF